MIAIGNTKAKACTELEFVLITRVGCYGTKRALMLESDKWLRCTRKALTRIAITSKSAIIKRTNNVRWECGKKGYANVN